MWIETHSAWKASSHLLLMMVSFNNSLNNNLTSEKQLQSLKSLRDLHLFSLNISTTANL